MQSPCFCHVGFHSPPPPPHQVQLQSFLCILLFSSISSPSIRPWSPMALSLPTILSPPPHISKLSLPQSLGASDAEVREWVSHPTPPSAKANVSPILFLLPAAQGFTMHPLNLWLDVFTNCRLKSPKRSEAPRRQAWCHRLSELSSGCGLSAIPTVSVSTCWRLYRF